MTDQNSKDIREIKKNVSTLGKNVSTLQKNVSTLQKTTDTLFDHFEVLNERMDGLEVRMGGLEVRMGGLEVRMDHMENDIKGIKGNQEKMMENIDYIVGAIQDQRQEKTIETHLLDRHEKQISGLDSRVGKLETAIAL